MASVVFGKSGDTPLFNGKDLTGWETDSPDLWSVKDGMIIGRANHIKSNKFLRTTKSFDGDFELKASLRLVNGEGNSGFQFWSKWDGTRVSGYQADAGQKYWGSLYDEARRAKLLVTVTPEGMSHVNNAGWNDYLITTRGRHITVKINGFTTADYEETDASIPQTGIIAIQVHAGFDMEAQIKNITIRKLK